MAKDKMKQPKEPKEQKIESQSGVNQKGEAFVQIILDGEVVAQLDVWQARDFGTGLVMTAEAAEQDAFIFDWVIRRVGCDPPQAAGMLQDFRKYREQTTFKRGGPVSGSDWVMPDGLGPPRPSGQPDVGKKK